MKPTRAEVVTACLISVAYLPLIIFYELKWFYERKRGLK